LFRAKAARDVVSTVLAGITSGGRELDLGDCVVMISGRPLPGGGALLVLHDVTEIRRLEAVRRDFVANVSHELKTPLTSISGYAETLVGEQPDPETTKRFLEVILANARRMHRLVDGLLDLSKIESGGWHPVVEPLDAPSVVRETWGLFAERAAARNIWIRAAVRWPGRNDSGRSRCPAPDPDQSLRQCAALHPAGRPHHGDAGAR
jgi:signal transduction histidine kinase